MVPGTEGVGAMHAAFSCFADLALVSPQDYRKEGQGSLLQCVLTPADPFMPLPNQEIADITHQQVAPARNPLPASPHRCAAMPAAVCQTPVPRRAVCMSAGRLA